MRIAADEGATWRIVELEDGLRVVVDPDGTIVGTTDAAPTAVLSPAATASATSTVTPASSPTPTSAPVPTDEPANPATPVALPVVGAALAPVTSAVTAVVGTTTGTVRDLAAAVVAPISFDTTGISDLATTLKTAAAAIEKELDQLTDVGKSLRGKWSGDTDDAFRTAHRAWSKQLDELHRILKDSARLAKEVEDSLVETESKIQDLWG